ncbi:MAG: hypothetical protein COB08_012530 [Rhodobacteraceae bacterium]|nr:hypothetical protein [Paracoccaceae bacterium]
MANKSPAELKSEGVELKAVLAKVKKKQHNCAMLMSKDGIVLEVHLKKSPEVLVKAAKKAGGMAKGVWGTITMEGQVIIIDPINDKIPGNLPKVAKKFFSERGLKNRLELKEPDGDAAASAEAPAEEESAAPTRRAAPEPEAEAAAPAPEAAAEESAPARGRAAPEDDAEAAAGGEEVDPRVALEERLEELQPRIDTLLADTASLMIDGLKDTMGLFTRAMDDELFERAGEALDKVTTVLDDYDGLMAEKQPFLDRMSAMARNVARIVSGADDTAATAIARFKREFEYAVENNEWYSSGEKLDQMEALIGEHASTDEEPDVEDELGVEDDGSAEAETSATENDDSEDASASESAGDDRSRLVDAFKTLTPQIKTALKSGDKDSVKKVGMLAKGFAKAIKGGDLAKSQKIMDILEPMVAQASESNQSADANVQAKGGRLKQLKQMRTRIASLFKEMQQ